MRTGRTARRHGAGLAAIAVALALVGGCSSEAETFALRLTWAQDGNQACPHAADAAATCASIPISCDARVRIRITDAITDEVFYSRCYPLTGITDACDLRDLPLETSAPIPNRMAKVQVMVWSAAQLAVVPGLPADGCPDTAEFDRTGQPLLPVGPIPMPALGGEIYFPVGDRRVAEVELGCPRHDLLDLAACRMGAPLLQATVRDPLSWASVDRTLVDSLDVRFGAPTADGKGGWNLGLGDLESLTASAGGELVWSKRLTQALPNLGCLRVLLSESRSTPAAICHDIAVSGGTINLEGFMVKKTLVNKLLFALDLADFPPEGLVLGVVVDSHNNRVAGARVSVSSGELAYPTDDFQHVGLDSTSASGLFLSTDAPFDAVWHGQDASGIGDDGTARGGLIGDHLTVVVIRLNTPLGGAR